MNRKKWIACLCALVLTISLCACGASESTSAATVAAEEAGNGYLGFTTGEMAEMDASSTADVGEKADQTQNEAKLIYTAELDMETTDFDTASSELEALVETFGGYMEFSSVSNGGDGYRYANYTVRVPAERFKSFLKQAGELCQVIYQSSGAEDISEYYYDTAGRLETQKTKLERLQTLLAKADKMEDIIALESAISETEEQIEYLSGELSHYDAQVDYATVNICLDEVYRLSGTTEPASGFGERVGSAFSSGWDAFVSGLQNFVVMLAYGWMWLLIIAVIVVVVICRVRKTWKARKRAKTDVAVKIQNDAAARIAAIGKVAQDSPAAGKSEDTSDQSDADKKDKA